MGHNGACANARRHACRCFGCGGAEHGWPYRVALAQDSSSARRKAFRVEVDKVWIEAKAKSRGGRLSQRAKAAGTDTAVADIVDWLAEHQYAIKHVQEVGNVLAGDAVNQVKRLTGPLDSKDFKSALLNHFWCDLLAAFVRVISQFNGLPERALEYVASAMLDSREGSRRLPVDDSMVELAFEVASKVIRKLLLGDAEDALRVIRILAILICPAPENHRAVAENCITPLTGGIISTATKARLMEVFPAEWLSGVQKSLAT